MKRSVLSALWLVAALAVAGPADTVPNTFEAYPLGLSDGAAIEQVARAIVGADGTVTLDAKNQRLLVLATPAEHQQIAGLLAKTAVTPRNVRIEVAMSGGEVETERGASVGGNVGIERTDGATTVRWKVKPRVVDRSVDVSSDTRQQLLVASGREGKLRVGETVPYQTWIVDYGVTHGILQQQIAWKEVGSFLVVEPTVIGEGPLIRVRVTPELVGLVGNSPHATRFTSLATEVTVRDGETITIGGDAKDSEFYSRFLIGGTRGGGSRRMNITMTPHILSPAAPPPAARPPPGPPSQIPPTIKVWGEERQVPARP